MRDDERFELCFRGGPLLWLILFEEGKKTTKKKSSLFAL